MKYFLSLLTFIFFSISVLAQQEKAHEIRIDALEVLVTPAIDLSYEYSINNSMGVGVSTFFRVDQPEDDFKRFALTPFVRQYFFNNMDFGQKGFYIEAFGQYVNGERERNGLGIVEDFDDFGVGFGGGLKWLTNNGFSLDIGAGVGRNFGVKEGSPDFFLRWGIQLGFRFL